MTNAEISRLSAPVVQAYRDCEDEILQLIGKQLGKYKKLGDTSKWRIRQLARAGEINRKAIDIINSYAGGIDTEAYEAIIAAAEGEVGVLDEAMLNLLSESGAMTDDVRGMLEAFERQSVQELNVKNAEIAGGYAKALTERFNLVNTVMGYQATSSFIQAVNSIYNDREKVVGELNAGAMAVVSGTESLNEATRRTIHRLAQKGIPGFVDKAGREWSPEAYVKMDLRSTLGNTARAAQDARCDAYGISLIAVSSHMGARPKCAPYQGRIFSRDGCTFAHEVRGTTKDGAGNDIEYIPLSETSYGEPDGLFGINCGHQQYPFIPGVNIQRYYPYDEEQNAKVYEQTQKQRAMERKIRADKRECMMLQENGDEEGLKKASQRLRADKDKYVAFSKQTRLGVHNENTQVYGYDRSKSMKTVWAGRTKGSGNGGSAANNLLTSGSNGGKIRNKDGNFDFYPVSDKALHGRLECTAFKDDRLNSAINREMHGILEKAQPLIPGTEVGCTINISDYTTSPYTIGPVGAGLIDIPQSRQPYVSIHNHASGETLSSDDLVALVTHGNEKGAFVIGNNGNIYGIIKDNDFDWQKFQFMILDKSHDDVLSEIIEGEARYGLSYYERAFR